MLYREPELCHALLMKITASTINYLKGQIASGADLVQIFDSWAGILSPEQYAEFSLKYIDLICKAITEVPVTVFAKGAYFALLDMDELECETIGLDWNMSAEDARYSLPYKTLQGNLDPCALYASKENVVAETKKMIDAFGTQNYIANLGHGVYPDIDPENVKVFVNTVKQYSEQKAVLELA
jgi:uroporphyrinogen decarboxylase